MQKILFVENGELDKVNELLGKGWYVKSIHPIAEPISAYGSAGGQYDHYTDGYYCGDIYAYVILEKE